MRDAHQQLGYETDAEYLIGKLTMFLLEDVIAAAIGVELAMERLRRA